MNIGLRDFYSFLHGEERLREKRRYILDILNKKGIGNFSFQKDGERYDLIANIILTGGTEQEFLKSLHQIKEPILILFDSQDNSLAATLELKTKLEDLKKKTLIYSINEDGERLKKVFAAIKTKQLLNGTRLGVVGIPSPWLVASIPDRDSVMEKFGIELVDIELQELYSEVERVSDEEIIHIEEEFINNAKVISEPKRGDIKGAIKIYVALKKIVDKYGLSSLTLACFTILDVLKNTGCLALSKLNDEGIVAGCEGDIQSTITMLILHKLTGEIPFMANPSGIDLEEKSIILAHCTVARKILKNYTIRSHFESGIGVGIQGEVDARDVTIFRIGGKNMDKHLLYTGSLMPIAHSENLCRTQIKVKLNEDPVYILEKPAGNHMIIVKGNHRESIESFLEIL